MNCPKCGNQIEDNQNFCSQCGSKISRPKEEKKIKSNLDKKQGTEGVLPISSKTQKNDTQASTDMANNQSEVKKQGSNIIISNNTGKLYNPSTPFIYGECSEATTKMYYSRKKKITICLVLCIVLFALAALTARIFFATDMPYMNNKGFKKSFEIDNVNITYSYFPEDGDNDMFIIKECVGTDQYGNVINIRLLAEENDYDSEKWTMVDGTINSVNVDELITSNDKAVLKIYSVMPELKNSLSFNLILDEDVFYISVNFRPVLILAGIFFISFILGIMAIIKNNNLKEIVSAINIRNMQALNKK